MGNELRKKADKEQHDFQMEWKRLGELINQDRKAKDIADLPEDDDEHRGNLTVEEEKIIKRKIAKGAWAIGKDKAQIHLSQEKVQSYEEAFAKIQAATGITDIEELVRRFIEAEDKNFSLFNYVNQLAAEIEKLEHQIQEVKVEIDKYRGQGANSDNQRKRILRDLEERLERTNAKADNYEQQHQDSMKILNQLKSGIAGLFNKIGCQTSDAIEILGTQGVTESNMMQYLGIIEQRANEVLQMFAATQHGGVATLQAFLGTQGQNNEQDGTPTSDVKSLQTPNKTGNNNTLNTNTQSKSMTTTTSMQGKTVTMSDKRKTVKVMPPTLDDMDNMEENDGEDDGERPLTMQELQHNMLKQINQQKQMNNMTLQQQNPNGEKQ